ncbi:uncharacterized protein LOC131806902 [Musca domestica]|uniref:Uncharacterized protein LOC131806902 n=1 Tax=Musca domestica TaxID=7370 RepID=A0ABM3VPM7_MUSDO|nr:uncharacterized protein LOC131806902 [Musca domestica]
MPKIVVSRYIVLGVFTFMTLTAGNVRFTNLKCDSLDPKFSIVEKCNLKLIRRGVVGLNITVKLLQIPVTNVSISLSFFKKSNGYQPYFYNTSADFCNFLKNRQKYPILQIVANYMLRNTNINHTCPFDHDIIAENLVLDKNIFKLLPFAVGDYMMRLMVSAYNDLKCEIKYYLSIYN